MELSSSSIKKSLTFSKKKAFLMFRETETPKKFLIFQETELFIFQETSHISENNFPISKNEKNLLCKNFLYFGKWDSPVPSLKSLLYFRKELTKHENKTF